MFPQTLHRVRKYSLQIKTMHLATDLLENRGASLCRKLNETTMYSEDNRVEKKTINASPTLSVFFG